MNEDYWAVYVYGKEYPDGLLLEAESQEELNAKVKKFTAKGFVDNPAKLRLNPWGTDEETVARIAADYEHGKVPALDQSLAMSREENEHLKRQVKAQEEELAALRSEQASRDTPKQNDEHYKDKASDAGLLDGDKHSHTVSMHIPDKGAEKATKAGKAKKAGAAYGVE